MKTTERFFAVLALREKLAADEITAGEPHFLNIPTRWTMAEQSEQRWYCESGHHMIRYIARLPSGLGFCAECAKRGVTTGRVLTFPPNADSALFAEIP